MFLEINEIIIDGYNGFLVPMKNPKLLADALLKLFKNEQLRDKLGKIGGEHVKKHFNWGTYNKPKFRRILLRF